VSVLFRGLEEKYGRREPTDQLQGAWIGTYLKQEESELIEAFQNMDPLRVHFAILGDWQDDGYLLVVDEALREAVLAAFQLRQSDRFVFRRQPRT
jgi:hypothetical protein